MISCFIQSTYTHEFPEFNERNIDTYRQLADEFEYDEFRTAIEEFELKKPYLLLDSYISNIKNESCNDLNVYESQIAEEFDFYLQNDECRRKIIDEVPLTQIHRILSNKNRKIEDHIKFYQFLKELIDNPREGENEDEIGLLLQFVDYKQLKGPSIADFISMSERYQLHIPGLNSTLHEQLEQMTKDINEFREQNKQMKREIQSIQEQNNQLYNQLIQEINELREQNKQMKQTLSTKDRNIQLHTERENKINQQFMHLIQEFSGIKSELRILQKTSDDIKEHEKSIDDTNKLHSIAITEINNWIEKNKPIIEQLHTKTEETQNQSTVNFNQQFKDISSLLFDRELHKFDMNETNEGVFSYLRGKQKNEFSPLFYTSQSTTDFYEMINWDSFHMIGSDTSGSFWHEFKFEETIHFSGIKVKSQIGGFPRSFDIKINNEVVYSTNNATKLNGEYKEMTIQFGQIKEGNIVRIEQTGPNWESTNHFKLNKIELYSTDEKYEGGVFKSLMKRYGNDPHKIHVIVSSKSFDHNSFHKLDSTTLVCILLMQIINILMLNFLTVE